MEARGAKRVKKMSTVHVGKWQFVIKGGGGVRWTSIGIVMYRAHARKRWRATLRGTYFSLKKEKSEVEVMCSLWNKTRKRTSIDHPNYISYLHAVFSTNNFLCLVTTSLIRPLDFSNEILPRRTEEARSRSGKSENSRRVSSTRCPWTVHLFSRNVTLALSDGNNRSGTANWPRGLIATNCSITRVHTLERIVARIQLLLAYTATRDRGSYRCTLGRIVFQRRKPVTREWYASYQDA